MKSIFVTRNIPGQGIAMLLAKGYEVDVYPYEAVPRQKDIIKYLKKKPYDGVISLLTDKIDSAVYDACPSAKIFSNYAVGYNNIDVKTAHEKNIAVTNTKGASSDCVAEFTVALMLALTTKLVEGDRYMREGRFDGWSPSLFLGTDLRGKTLGLIGAGHIGERVIQSAVRGFGMRVVYYDIARNEKIDKEFPGSYSNTIEEVLKEADIVSLHVPLLDSTHHLMNANRFKMMKKTAYLVNTSRGPVVDEMALLFALENKTIRGAAIDVYEFEPKVTRGLTKLQNIITTPHIASARESARAEMSRLTAQNIIDFFDGKEPVGLIK